MKAVTMRDTFNYSPTEILKLIGIYSKKSIGKKEIKEVLKTKDFNLSYEDKNKLRTVKQMKRKAEELADMIYNHMLTDTVREKTSASGHTYRTVGLSEFGRENIVVGDPYIHTNIGRRRHTSIPIMRPDEGYMIDVGFEDSEKVLHRDSLLPGKYDGIDDIIKLFVHGYKYRNSEARVHGIWYKHGSGEAIEVTGMSEREPNNFLENAVKQFNTKYKDTAVATIRPDYKR